MGSFMYFLPGKGQVFRAIGGPEVFVPRFIIFKIRVRQLQSIARKCETHTRDLHMHVQVGTVGWRVALKWRVG